ncbi:MAG: ABC transporter permease [Oscillospiraceae bacterium]|nr:ABC transporter permease [Oscillospiraceae bacterium]
MSVIDYFYSLDPAKLLKNLPGGIAQGILWGLMALGVYITFRLIKVSDLTVEGSFATGGAVTVVLITGGGPAWLRAIFGASSEQFPTWAALLIAFFVGVLCGLVTGMLHSYLGIPAILAGILTQLALFSVNLHIMDMSSNIPVSVDKYPLYVSGSYVLRSIPVAAVITAAIIGILYWYFGTEQGSAIRSTGNNPVMSSAQGIDIEKMKMIGFAISNGIVALAGGLVAQYQGFADVNMGRGASVIGLAAVIIGDVASRAIFKGHINFAVKMAFVILGGIVYYAVVILVLWMKLNTNDLKLFTALIVALFLGIPYLQSKKRESFASAAKGGSGNAET